MDFSNISGHTNRDYCFNIKYFPNDETESNHSEGDNVYTSPLGHVAAGLGLTDPRTSFNPSTNEAGKAVLVTPILFDQRWASHDRQGGYCRLKQTVYIEVTAVPAQDFIHHLQHLDHRKGRSNKIRTGQVCQYRADPTAQ